MLLSYNAQTMDAHHLDATQHVPHRFTTLGHRLDDANITIAPGPAQTSKVDVALLADRTRCLAIHTHHAARNTLRHSTRRRHPLFHRHRARTAYHGPQGTHTWWGTLAININTFNANAYSLVVPIDAHTNPIYADHLRPPYRLQGVQRQLRPTHGPLSLMQRRPSRRHRPRTGPRLDKSCCHHDSPTPHTQAHPGMFDSSTHVTLFAEPAHPGTDPPPLLHKRTLDVHLRHHPAIDAVALAADAHHRTWTTLKTSQHMPSTTTLHTTTHGTKVGDPLTDVAFDAT